MTARLPAPQDDLTPRAAAIAGEQGYGAYQASFRVNRMSDRHLAIAVLMLPVGAGVFSWMAWFASPWSGNDAPSLPGMVASGIAGLFFLGCTVWLAVPLLVGMVRVKGARVYVFEHGAIAERPRGSLYAWKLDRATVRYVVWKESWESTWRDRPQLWVRFHQDGEVICFDGHDRKDRAVLPELARALGAASDEPEQIGELRSSDAPTSF